MNKKFVTEAEMCRKDTWLPEALMCIAYFQDVQEEKMAQSMNIDVSHAEKLIGLLEEFGFVKTENGKKKLTFTQKEYLETYGYSFRDLENLFGEQKTELEKLAERDSLLPDALSFAVEKSTISTISLMRRYGIGYPRAAKIVDVMEEMGYISPSNENIIRTVYIKKEDLDNLSKFSVKTHKREDFYTKDEKRLMQEHKNDFGLDNIKFLDENGKALNANKSKHLKNILLEQFCGLGIICMEIQDAQVFFKKNNNVMRCKTFEAPTGEELKNFINENKIDSAIILFEVSPRNSLKEMEQLIPKIDLLFFAIATPLPTVNKIKANILY